MAVRNSAITLGKQIRTLFDAGALGALPDRGLLDHFARGGETAEPAFATLVERHGTMVLHVCRQLLNDSHLAEDAFQVTFLLLARRASSIHNPDALAGWLHRVARRFALRARAAIRRRQGRERAEAGEFVVAEADPLEQDELCAIIHEEIDNLGDAQRLPILLCALEGLSHEEAAQRLRWPVGTVKSRLVRGRRRLQGRLARRGLAPAIALAAVAAQTNASAAPVPLALAVAATRTALTAAVGGIAAAGSVSTSIAAMLQKELSTLLLAKLALAAAAVLGAGVAVAVIVLMLAGPFGRRAPTIEPEPTRAQPLVAQAPSVPPTNRASVAATKQTTVAETKQSTIPEINRSLSQSPAGTFGGEFQDEVAVKRPLSAFGKQVERAIHDGTGFLKSQQRVDGSWPDVEQESKTGVTSLVTLALLTAGEKPDSPPVRKALAYLRRFGPNDLRSTYAISLQTQVFAAAAQVQDRSGIANNVSWLERAQIKPGDAVVWPGSWTYSNSKHTRPGDNSNTQYALLGLHAASEAGVPVRPVVWERARVYWEKGQKRDGSWAYTPNAANPTASMTCAGVSSLIMAGLGRGQGKEHLQGEAINDCGKGTVNRHLQTAIDWLATHFQVDQNIGSGKQWRFYYLHGLERAGRLAGIRFFGEHDWFRLGAEELVREQNKLSGCWVGQIIESDQVLATSFALLFLAKGRAPVLINKLRHAPATDWDNDPDDVRNIVNVISRDWRSLLTWQVVDSQKATVADLLRAPILFINGHEAPEFDARERKNLRAYVDEGGFIFAEACCGSAGFDKGFSKLMEELFPDRQERLLPLAGDHPIWRSRHLLSSEIHPLLGISRGGRTVVVYSPSDLSCYWNQAQRSPADPAVIKAIKFGQNVVDYATGRELPPDKLSGP